MSSTRLFAYIDSASALEKLARELSDSEWVAIDTEFIRDRTYFPKFCLLQLAARDRVACIDVLALEDLAPLDPLFDDERIVKVFHAARQDLEILYRLRGRLPRPIFDTQLAAPFVGHPDQIGYAALASELLNATVEKTHSRTDWSIRPLTPAQLAYAADDVFYLGRIYESLLGTLTELGRLHWVEEETRSLTDTRLYAPPPEDAWLRIGGISQLNASQTAALRVLAAWRETFARQQDCPRNWLIKDEILVDLARQQPKTADELRLIRGLDERIAKRYGPSLLQMLQEIATRPLPPQPPRSKPPGRETPEQEALLDVFTAVVRLRAAEHRITPSMLASRKELREFIESPSSTRLIQGWRKAIVGEDLFAMITGRKSLSVIEGSLKIIDHVE